MHSVLTKVNKWNAILGVDVSADIAGSEYLMNRSIDDCTP